MAFARTSYQSAGCTSGRGIHAEGIERVSGSAALFADSSRQRADRSTSAILKRIVLGLREMIGDHVTVIELEVIPKRTSLHVRSSSISDCFKFVKKHAPGYAPGAFYGIASLLRTPLQLQQLLVEYSSWSSPSANRDATAMPERPSCNSYSNANCKWSLKANRPTVRAATVEPNSGSPVRSNGVKKSFPVSSAKISCSPFASSAENAIAP